MRHGFKVLAATLALGAMALGAPAAKADPITMYYSLDGMTYFQLAPTTTNGVNIFGGAIASSPYTVTFSATGTGTANSPLPEPFFNTSTIAINSTSAGSLYLAAVETGITNTNVAGFNVSFGSNAGNTGSIQELFAVGQSLNLSSPGLLSTTLLANSPNITLSAAAPVLTAPYQVAEQYKVTFTSAGTIQGTIQENAYVPEPVSISLLGAGLIGLGVIRRRGRKSA